MKNNRLIVISLFFFCFIINMAVYSQTTTYSPYSQFGLGEIEYFDLGRNSGMGGTGIGLQSFQSLNRLNPASYSSLDSLSFTSEVSVSSKFSQYTNGRVSQNNTLASFKKLAFGFRVSRMWATSFGLVPYSYSGYNIASSKIIQGTPGSTFNINQKGDGVINKLYFGNAFSITRNLSVGFNTSLHFGTLYKVEESTSASFSSIFKYSDQIYLNKLNFDFGIQYSAQLSEKYKFTLGAIYGYNNKFKLQHKAVINITGVDVTDEENSYSTSESLPWFTGGGISLTYNNSLTYAFDYYIQKWSDNKSNEPNVKFVDNKRFATGLEYRPNVRIPKNYFQRMFYQVGFNYNQSYLQLHGQQINDIAGTIGLGFPVKGDRSYFCLSFQGGQKGKVSNGLFKENYLQINFNIIFRDIWFLKSKFD